MAWVGRDLKNNLVLIPMPWRQGHLSAEQAAQKMLGSLTDAEQSKDR